MMIRLLRGLALGAVLAGFASGCGSEPSRPDKFVEPPKDEGPKPGGEGGKDQPPPPPPPPPPEDG